MLSEDVLEEMPQSMAEHALQNFALDKPVDEGLDAAAAQGLLARGAGARRARRARFSGTGTGTGCSRMSKLSGASALVLAASNS
ncbi:hypothetical protein [Variovorax sp.]|uniref:hypothetical protein n=1 Tax=Variovorax sp. TaxID=1871043 RepID=UPI00122075F3|nr:hypothetical protein [Variovorax sp.]TAJ57679.1 MAG: hypothetical protein EPO53_35890 [Variovorax sp.]